MTAPEDQNGLREALARADQDDIVGLLGEVAQAMVNRGLHPAAGPVRRAARYITALRTELDVDRASLRAAEAEITRLKEGMEAVVGALKLAENPLSYRNAVDPNGPGSFAVARALDAVRSALATLFPKEQPNG